MFLPLCKTARLLSVLAITLLVGACSPRQMIVGQLADELAAQSGGTERDLDLLRDAAPFHLKLSESVLGRNPGHLRLAESVAAGFTQYAYAFVAFEAEKVESRDAKAAERLRQRAARLYERAHRHAMEALELASPGFAESLARQNAQAVHIRPEWVGLAYWAAASWGGWISLSKDDPEVVADLPVAYFLARQAWASDPEWGNGALSSLLGSFEAARPGGSMTQALAYFDQAIRQSNGTAPGPLLAKAEGYALPRGDRALFDTLISQALAIQDPKDSATATENEVMRQRARWLQEKADDLF